VPATTGTDLTTHGSRGRATFFRPLSSTPAVPCAPEAMFAPGGRGPATHQRSGHERHWTRHRGPTMHQASRGHAGGVSATVGLGVPKVPGGRPVDPTAVPVVPLPLFGLLNLYPLSWTFARLPVPLLFRRERRSALLSAGIAYSSALVSPGSRLPHEAGRLFTRQSPQGSASPTRSSRSLSTFRPFFAADRGGRFLSSRDS
jgi:hypothetical protein